MSEDKTCRACQDQPSTPAACGTDRSAPPDTVEEFLDEQALEQRLSRIRRKILVMSGKGGVGKSTVAANLAMALAMAGKQVGLLDVDIHGPSIPTMLKLERGLVQGTSGGICPVEKDGIKVMSVGLLLRQQDDALIWRGPMKMGVIKQFLKDVDWGVLDALIIDAPPGTGDEPLSVAQLAAPLDGAVIVTTPQDVATADVRKSINFCRQLSIPVLGVVENMSGFVCPSCKTVTAIFKSGGGERMAADMDVPFLGRLPIDPAIGEGSDSGQPFVKQGRETPLAEAFDHVVAPVLALLEAKPNENKVNESRKKGPSVMKIAIPLTEGKLSMHFGHCEQFALLDVDEQKNVVVGTTLLTPPAHEPGVLPRWLHEQGANVIVAGGMGQRAQDLFAENNIKVIVGAEESSPEQIARDYLAGTLKAGSNVCDH